MSYNVNAIISNTEALLKLRHDETLTSTTPQRLHDCLGTAVMMAINETWTASKKRRESGRKAYYFSAEYLMGRLVYSNLFNLGLLEQIKNALAAKGVDLAELEDIEDAALGNGGLGRLAACFLDSAVTCSIPLSGYGLRYRFGLFKQTFDDNGSQRLTWRWLGLRITSAPGHGPGRAGAPQLAGEPGQRSETPGVHTPDRKQHGRKAVRFL